MGQTTNKESSTSKDVQGFKRFLIDVREAILDHEYDLTLLHEIASWMTILAGDMGYLLDESEILDDPLCMHAIKALNNLIEGWSADDLEDIE